MKDIKISQLHTLEVYNSKEYINNNKEVNDSILNVLESYEVNETGRNINKAREYIEDLNFKIFSSDANVQIYVMKREEQPVSFVIYEKRKDTPAWMVEMIYTHDDYIKLGLATSLLRHSAKHLKTTCDAQKILSAVSVNNIAGVHLFDSFAKVEGVDGKISEKESKLRFIFNISEMQANKTNKEEDELLF